MLQEVRRYVGNVLVAQSGSGATYALRRQVLLTDRLGSTQVLDAMTLQPVNPVGPASPMSFDAWGQRRDSASWEATVPWTQGLENLLKSSTTHGYTGHEMVESVGVIHMNGRIYNPRLARFLQAAPFVQSPDNGQNWNRYSYTFNNPLAYMDPSGNLSVGDWARTVAAIAITYWTGGMAAGVIQTAGGLSAAVSSGAIWNAAAWSVAGGFAAGAVQSGSLKGAVAGAVSSGLFFSIGTSFSQGVGGDWMFQGGGLSFEGYAAKTLSHGMAGGVLETLQGGRFGHGFLSAGVSEALSPVIGRAQNPLAEGVIRSVVGGTASVAGGGKFANGAVTAAFGFAFNHLGHSSVGAVLTKTVEITDLELNPYVGPLSNSQNDDVNSINSSIAMLGKTVEASGNSDYIEKFNNTSFNYVPGYEDQTSLRTAGFAGINPRTGGYLIRFTAGFHKYERPGDYIAKS